MTYTIRYKKDINDLKRDAEQTLESIVGKSKTLEKVIKIHRSSEFMPTYRLFKQKQNQKN